MPLPNKPENQLENSFDVVHGELAVRNDLVVLAQNVGRDKAAIENFRTENVLLINSIDIIREGTPLPAEMEGTVFEQASHHIDAKEFDVLQTVFGKHPRQTLDLDWFNVRDGSVIRLSADPWFDEEDLPGLSHFKKLRELRIDPVGNIDFLRGMSTLERLSRIQLNEGSIEVLKSLKNLKHLDISIRSKGRLELKDFPYLETFHSSMVGQINIAEKAAELGMRREDLALDPRVGIVLNHQRN